MKRCTTCHSPLAISNSANPRPAVIPGILYGLMFECPHCSSSQFHTLWREPEEDELLLAGELDESVNSLSDLRTIDEAA